METHKQAATEGDCSKNLAEHLKGGNACMYVCPICLYPCVCNVRSIQRQGCALFYRVLFIRSAPFVL